MATTELMRIGDDRGAIQLMLDLEQAGAVDEVSLVLTDPTLPFETWDALGTLLGRIHRASSWYIGDWLLFGEAVYGEDHAQAIEAVPSDRYDVAQRTTGLDPGSLMNIASVCRKVARKRRMKELSFGHHAEVAKLEPPDQSRWLKRALKEGWTRNDLRRHLADHLAGSDADPGEFEGGGGDDSLSPKQQLERAVDLVIESLQSTTTGDFLVPAGPVHQLAAARGRDIPG